MYSAITAALVVLALLGDVANAQSTDLTYNSKLKRSFYGMAYSPTGAILPDCGATQAQVNADIFQLAQLTPRIRLYGADCNQTALVLSAIKETKVDLSVYVGIFIPSPVNQTVVDRQASAVLDAIKTYGTENVVGITVGNEFLLNSYGSGTATDSAGVAARSQLIEIASNFNDTLKSQNFDKNIPVGTADAGSAVTAPLCDGFDYIMANIHPWFGSVPIDQAAGWTWQFEQDFAVSVCASSPNKPQIYVAETGWPTKSDNASSTTNGQSEASVANLQKYIDTYVCQSNKNGTEYFFFEFKDELWKKVYGGVEPYWGLYDSNRVLKDITFPDCTVDSPTGKSAPTASISNPAVPGSKTNGSTTSTSSSPSSTQSEKNASAQLALPWCIAVLISICLSLSI